jgi:hypothetical protein
MTLELANKLVRGRASLLAEAQRLGLTTPDAAADAIAEDLARIFTEIPEAAADTDLGPDAAAARVRGYVFEDLARVHAWNGWHARELRELHAALLAAERHQEAADFARRHRTALAPERPPNFIRPSRYLR